MAKFRRNHKKSGNAGVSIIRIILIVVVVGVVFYLLSNLLGKMNFEPDYQLSSDELTDSLYHLPSGSSGQIVHHEHFSLSYIEKYEQAEWVAYELTKASLKKPNVPRAKRFEDDPLVRTGSATYYDYKGSGYSRGHLAPAADMAFSKEAMADCFFMSNMSPQLSVFNGGVWNELENLVRDWAYDNDRLIVVTGPIFSKNMKKIKNGVAVPEKYYKVLLDFDTPDKKAIGFILPHEKSEERMDAFAVSVDDVEAETGLNFFSSLLDSTLEEDLEKSFDMSAWPLDESLYRQRVDHWNNR